jgi:hypothetical protein
MNPTGSPVLDFLAGIAAVLLIAIASIIAILLLVVFMNYLANKPPRPRLKK